MDSQPKPDTATVHEPPVAAAPPTPVPVEPPKDTAPAPVEAVKDPATPAELPVAEPPQDPLEAVVTADQAKPVSGASSQKPALAIIVAVVFFVALCAVAYYAYAKSA